MIYRNELKQQIDAMYGGSSGGMVYYNPYLAQVAAPTTSPTWIDGAGAGGDVTNIGLHGYQTPVALTSHPHSLNTIHSKQSNCKKLGLTANPAGLDGGNVYQKLTKYHPYNSFTLPAHVSERRHVSHLGQRHVRLAPTVQHQEAGPTPVSSELLFRYAAGGGGGAGMVMPTLPSISVPPVLYITPPTPASSSTPAHLDRGWTIPTVTSVRDPASDNVQ